MHVCPQCYSDRVINNESIKTLGVTHLSGVECTSQPVGPRREDTP